MPLLFGDVEGLCCADHKRYARSTYIRESDSTCMRSDLPSWRATSRQTVLNRYVPSGFASSARIAALSAKAREWRRGRIQRTRCTRSRAMFPASASAQRGSRNARLGATDLALEGLAPCGATTAAASVDPGHEYRYSTDALRQVACSFSRFVWSPLDAFAFNAARAAGVAPSSRRMFIRCGIK